MTTVSALTLLSYLIVSSYNLAGLQSVNIWVSTKNVIDKHMHSSSPRQYSPFQESKWLKYSLVMCKSNRLWMKQQFICGAENGSYADVIGLGPKSPTKPTGSLSTSVGYPRQRQRERYYSLPATKPCNMYSRFTCSDGQLDAATSTPTLNSEQAISSTSQETESRNISRANSVSFLTG